MRACQRCSSQFQSQGHVIDSTNLNQSLAENPELASLVANAQSNYRWIFETYLEAVRMSPYEYAQSYVSALEESIRSSLRLVFGESY